jgi:hypothetical protein
MHANARAVDLLESRCPICGLPLTPAAAASRVIGLRLFDLDAFAEGEPAAALNDPRVPRSPASL